MWSVVARLILRYGAGALVAYGLLSDETGQTLALDPDIAILLGSGLAAGVELLYTYAKKKGWKT